MLPRLQSYGETLNGIQKALGEYLEKQRSAFPRFYFVGDEDLLEIIGNAKNPVKVSCPLLNLLVPIVELRSAPPPQVIRHLPKMFAGIEAVLIQENTAVLTGSYPTRPVSSFRLCFCFLVAAMVSKEGEEVPLKQAIDVAKFDTIHGQLPVF
jgi:dynein heavy chain 1